MSSSSSRRGVMLSLGITAGIIILAVVAGGVALLQLSSQFEQERTQAESVFVPYQSLTSDMIAVVNQYQSRQFETQSVRVQGAENFYQELNNSFNTITEQYDEIAATRDTLESETDFIQRFDDAYANSAVHLASIRSVIQADECGRNQMYIFQSLQQQIDQSEKDLGEFVIVLDAQTLDKLRALADQYQSLSQATTAGIDCFQESLTIPDESQSAFAQEAQIYATIADVLRRQATVTEDVEQFNVIGSERPLTYTVYLQQTIPIWLEENDSVMQSAQQKMSIDVTSLSQYYSEKYTS